MIMNENMNKDNGLRIKFENINNDYKELVSDVNSLKVKITIIYNKILGFRKGIEDSKKLDKIMYIIAAVIIGITSSIGLLSNTGFSSMIVGVGALSLSIPFVCLIQSANFKLHVEKIIDDLNDELCICQNSLNEKERKLIDKKKEMYDTFYELVNDKVASNNKPKNLGKENRLKVYEKPHVRVKKIN